MTDLKIGISFNPYGNTFGRYGAEKFAKLNEQGYDAADINLSDTTTELYSVDEQELKEILDRELRAARRAGITISQVHGPWRSPPRDAVPEDRAERMEKMKRAVVITALLQCPYVVIHPIMPYGTEDIAAGRAEDTRALNLAFFKELVAFAKGYDVTVCLENMPCRDFSLATPEQILSFVREVDDDHFGICLDTGHVAFIPGLSAGEEVRRLGKYIKVLHLHDNMGDNDRHLSPMDGIIDWPDLLQALKEIGFSGVLSLETKIPGNYDDARFAEESIKLNRLFRQLVEKTEAKTPQI